MGNYCSRGGNDKGFSISKKQVSVSVVEQIYMLASGLLLVAGLLFFTRLDQLTSSLDATKLVTVTVLLLFLGLGIFLFFRWTIRKFGISGKPHLHSRLFFLSSGYMLLWCLSALPLLILLHTQYHLSPFEIIEASSAFIVATICGWLAIFSPSGLGVREFVFSFFSPNSMSWQQALFWITLHRVLWTGFDLFYGTLTLALITFRKRSANATN